MAARYELLPTIIHFAKRIGIVNRLALFVGLVFFSTAQAATTSGDASNGALLWDTYHCSGCHNTPPAQRQLNAANASNVIDYQITNGMLTNPPAAARNDIAAYIATQISDPNPANLAIPYNSVGTVFKIPDISLNTGFSNDTFTSIVTVSGPSKGTVTFNKLNATYTPTTGQIGADSFTYNATGPAGTSNIRTVTLVIADPPPVVTNPGTMTATSGSAFSYQIVATNSPTSYSITAIGLTLGVSVSGLVTGTLPTVTSPTNYSVTLNATNASGTGSQTFTLTVNPSAPVVTNPGSMTAASGAAFSYQIVATNSPTSYSVTASGLTLSVSSSGLVTGTLPTVTSPTDYSVTLNATNAGGTGSQTFTLTVNPSAPVVTNPGSMTAASGAAFSYPIVATNSPTSYSVTATGLTLSVNGSGLVTGTLPTVTSPTDYSVTLSATNAGGTGSQTFTLTVNPPAPVVTNPGSMTAASGAFSYQIIATNSPTSYNVTATGLTLSVDSSGLVTGTLPGVGTPTNYSVTLDASNSTGTGSQTFTLTVNPAGAPVTTNPGSMTAASGSAFSYQIVATNPLPVIA
ncbi:MAG: putative Ig domain-containing protein [Gallionellaceae bacterium]|nr:putative Ig domain-containing protein [Gallionellaceae bacterium]